MHTTETLMKFIASQLLEKSMTLSTNGWMLGTNEYSEYPTLIHPDTRMLLEVHISDKGTLDYYELSHPYSDTVQELFDTNPDDFQLACNLSDGFELDPEIDIVNFRSSCVATIARIGEVLENM